MFTAGFFPRDSQICVSLGQHSILFDGLAPWIGILGKWASPLTKLARDGEYRLAWFIKFIIFQGCSIKQAASLHGQPAPYN